jgi:hypothetical protein
LLKTHLLVLLLLALFFSASSARAYGPLNHLCVAEQHWNEMWSMIHNVGSISEAKAYQAALAGAMSDDLGYYFTGNKELELLTDAVHYAHTGEWVAHQLRDAQDRHDAQLFAFALGELSHYSADRMGHFYGTNVVVVQLTSNGPAKYGWRESYEQDKGLHTVVEAGFDFISIPADCSPATITRIAEKLNIAGMEFGSVVEFVNKQISDLYYGPFPAIKLDVFVDALLTAYFMFGETAIEAEELYGVTPPDNHLLRDFRDTVLNLLKRNKREDNVSAASSWISKGKYFAQTQKDSSKDTFAHSYEVVGTFYDGILKRALSNASKKDWSDFNLPNFNLDTNMKSASGLYVLADETIEHLLSHSQGDKKIDCPPKSSLFRDYFQEGQKWRALLTDPAGRPTTASDLKSALQQVGEVFRHVHGKTLNDLIPIPDAAIQIQPCASAACSPSASNFIFPEGSGLYAAAGTVSYPSNATLADLWLASLAATLLKNSNDLSVARKWARTVISEYRIDDLSGLNTLGYYPSQFCK